MENAEVQMWAMKKDLFFKEYVSLIRNGACSYLLLQNQGNCSHKSLITHVNFDR